MKPSPAQGDQRTQEKQSGASAPPPHHHGRGVAHRRPHAESRRASAEAPFHSEGRITNRARSRGVDSLPSPPSICSANNLVGMRLHERTKVENATACYVIATFFFLSWCLLLGQKAHTPKNIRGSQFYTPEFCFSL